MRINKKLIMLLSLVIMLVIIFAFGGSALAADIGLSNNDIIYMILTDRYPDGDPSNNGTLGVEYRPGELKYTQGGDWQGIIDKIPYIADLGVTAIWISPPSENELLSRDGTESGYHGYFTHDYYSADPHYGTKAKLQELVSVAHANGIKVILDAVPNHTADYLEPYETSYSSPDYQPAPPFNDPSWYHHNGDIEDWDDQWQVENCDLGGLDDLDQDNASARQEIKNVYKMWVDDTGVDAVRVDAARSVPKDFLQEFENYLGVPTFGEVFYGDVDYVSDYQNYEWGVLDFPLFFQAREVFAWEESFQKIKDIIDQDYKYEDPNKLITFLDNHDRDRFLCLAEDSYRKLRLGMTFLFTNRGIPDVYYGTEQAFYGGGIQTEWQGIANEANREVMDMFDQDNIIYKHIKRLTQIRKDYEPLSSGTQREMWFEDTVYSYSRRNDTTGEEVITVLNNSWDPIIRTIPIRAESSLTIGTTLTNLLDTSQKVTITSGGITGKQITVTVPMFNAVILVKGSPQDYTPPIPTVTKIRVHYDVGWDNTMYVRGDTYPLWWDKGRMMRNVASDIWEFENERIPEGQTFEFKPLINDTTWSQGNNFVGTGGQTIDVYPNF